jgi:hypothetical protein
MVIQGRVHHGVVVLEGNQSLPEGAAVTIVYQDKPAATTERKMKRVQFPLVSSDRPGALHLTSERIAEIMDEEDAASGH